LKKLERRCMRRAQELRKETRAQQGKLAALELQITAGRPTLSGAQNREQLWAKPECASMQLRSGLSCGFVGTMETDFDRLMRIESARVRSSQEMDELSGNVKLEVLVRRKSIEERYAQRVAWTLGKRWAAIAQGSDKTNPIGRGRAPSRVAKHSHAAYTS